MYGIKVNEEYSEAFQASNGIFVPEKFTPEGYRGLVRGRIFRDIDGMEVWDEEFVYKDDPYAMEEDAELSELLYFALTAYGWESFNTGNLPSHYHWQVETTKQSGIMIDFFLPEKILEFPILDFNFKGEEYHIVFECEDVEDRRAIS